jgi:diguanylate cyclase (GGDEF)-like protein
MRLFRRQDTVLIGALVVAFVVVFAPSASVVVDYANYLDATGAALLRALVILVVVFSAVQASKRHERRTAEIAAAAERTAAAERIGEMQRLVAFGQALARALDDESIRAAASAHLALLAPGRSIWALVRKGAQWKTLAVVGESTAAERERAATRALSDGERDADVVADSCFPMILAGVPVGVLGVESVPPLTDHQRTVLAAAATLLAVSVKNAELFGAVHDDSVRDSLTGCFNRKHALEVLDAELRRARRSQLPLSVLMFDLDHFKSVNDTFGHLCGDAVLAAVGARMNAVLRGSDLKCRYGGEEFLVVLPDTPLAGARRVAETLRREIADRAVTWDEGTVHVTASIGVTTVVPGELDSHDIVSRVDTALYRAKDDGRNCIRIADTAAHERLSAGQSSSAA